MNKTLDETFNFIEETILNLHEWSNEDMNISSLEALVTQAMNVTLNTTQKDIVGKVSDTEALASMTKLYHAQDQEILQSIQDLKMINQVIS